MVSHQSWLFRKRALFIFFWLSLLTFLVLNQAFAATTYYVSTSGSDGASGQSLSSPFRTIGRALEVVSAGDTVLIRGGTYREQLNASRGGTAGNYVTVANYNGEVPVIKGSEVVTGWTQHSGGIWKRTGWTHNSQQVFVDFDSRPGKPLQQIGMPSNYTSFEYIAPVGSGLYSMTPGSFYYDRGSATLYVWLADGSSPNSHVMEASTRMRLFFMSATWIRLKGLTFRHTNASGFSQQGNAVELSSNSIVENCDIQWTDFTGIGMGYLQANTVAVNNIVSNNGATGISAAGSMAFRVAQNQLNGNNYRNFNSQWHAAGFKGAAGAYGTVEGNEVAYNKASGIWCDTCRSGNLVVIRNNYVHDNGPKEAGIFVEDTRNALIYNNVVANNERRGLYVAASNGVQVMNNTFAGNRGWAAVDFHGMPRTGGTLRDNTFYNNIISGSTTVYDLEIVASNGSDIGNNKSNFNNIYRGGQPLILASAQMASTLSAWRTATGHDINSISADPRYVSPGSPMGYAIADGSPVIDKGASLGTVVADYAAAPRPQGAGYDMGAFEKGSGGTAPPPTSPTPSPTGQDTTLPVVSFVGLAPTATVNTTLNITASATDNVRVTDMSLYIDGTKKASSASGQIAYAWNLSGVRIGSHEVRVSASDAAQNLGKAVTTLVVQEAGATPPPYSPPPSSPPSTDARDTTPPTVSISAPGNGSTVVGVVNISASAMDNRAVTQMTVLVDGVVKATSSSGSINYNWSTWGLRSGTHAIRVSAGDAAQNTGSGNISVVVQ